jgi:hypothetical protein
MDGGEGADVFHFFAESGGDRQAVIVVHFDANEDRIDISNGVTGIDESISGSGNLEDLVNSEVLDAHHAVLVLQRDPPTDIERGGVDARGGRLFLVIDYNGDAGYQRGEDILVRLKKAIDIDIDLDNFF